MPVRLFAPTAILFTLTLTGCPDRSAEAPADQNPPAEVSTEPAGDPPDARPADTPATSQIQGNPMSRDIREPAVAGSWYSDDRDELSREIDQYLAPHEPGPDLPMALVAPHAGYRFSGPTAAHAFATVRGKAVRRVWVLAPTHRIRMSGVGLYPVDAFRTPLGDLPLARDVMDRLAAAPGFTWLDSGDGGEHSLEIELPFLQRALGAFELVPLLVGALGPADARALADVIRPELGAGDLVVVSTDFTHYGQSFGFSPFGSPKDTRELARRLRDLDMGAWERLAARDPEALHSYVQETVATICGRNPMSLLAALMPDEASATMLAWSTSGELTGDWSHTVSYLAGRVDGPGWGGRGPSTGEARLVDRDTARTLLGLAHSSLEHWFRHGAHMEVDPATIPEAARQDLGAFVTLERDGQLRGCIGEITPQRPAWQAVLERAVDAATNDPRFPPVTPDEFAHLELEVSLLGPSWEAASADDFIVGRHGIVLSRGSRRATFLPQVAPDQGWDRDTTLKHLARKAGIPVASLDDARVELYEAQVIAE